MKFPTTKQLKKTADSYNRKAFKKQIKKDLREFKKIIKRHSKEGKHNYNICLEERMGYYWHRWVMFRYLRRFSGLNIEIQEDDIIITKSGIKFVDRIYINVKW